MSTNHLQGELWGTAPTDWALYLETTFTPLYQKVISKSGLQAGKQLLDIGCGTGLFLRMAGATGATLTGIDVSPEMLEVARERNPGATLIGQDMDKLSFPEKSFDLVTGFNSLQYAEDIVKTLKDIRQLLKEDAFLVIGIWGTDAECESLKVLSSIASLLPEPAPGTPGPLALSGEGRVETLLSEAGLELKEKGTANCHWNFSSLDEATRGILAAGPSVEAIRYAGLEKVKEQLVKTLAPFNIYEEMFVLENVFHYFIAGNPGTK